MGLYSGGLIIGKKFAFEVWGGGRAYFKEGLFFGGAVLNTNASPLAQD